MIIIDIAGYALPSRAGSQETSLSSMIRISGNEGRVGSEGSLFLRQFCLTTIASGNHLIHAELSSETA